MRFVGIQCWKLNAEMANRFIDGFHDKEAVSKMKYRHLGNTDMNVSVLSFGSAVFGNVYENDIGDDLSCCLVLRNVISSGINYIDTAPWYGNGDYKAEIVLGKALKGIPREAYYIATKVGRYKPEWDQMFDFSADRITRSIDESLHRLGLDYVDVIQVHDIEFAPSIDIIINETLPALQKVKAAGKARYIGITGYPLEIFSQVLERSTVKIDTVLSYCHLSMNDSSLLNMLPYFKEKGIGVVNASPISMGLLSHRGPPHWHPATQDIRDACQKAAAYCQERNVDISKLALHYTLSFEDVPTTLVSTASIDNMSRNIAAVHEMLSPLETETMKEVMEQFMTPLDNKNWEGVEVNEYRQEIQKLKEGN